MVFRVSAVPNSPQFPPSVGADPQNPCQYCHRPIPGAYYRIRYAMACPSCAEQVRVAMAKHKAGRYPLALVFGMGAALIGMFLNAAFFVFTGWIVSLPALAVGWMIGSVMKKGSGGTGGRLYQVSAALLTYVAISMSSLPVGLHYARERELAAYRARVRAAQHSFGQPDRPLTPEQLQAREQDLAARQQQLEEEFGQAHAERRPFQRSFPPPYLPSGPTTAPDGNPARPPVPPLLPQSAPRPGPQVRVIQPNVQGAPTKIIGARLPQAATPGFSFFGFLRQFLWLTIASPFAFFWLKGPTLETSLNFVLLIIGMVFAWRITTGVELVIFGPFDASTQPTPLK